MGRGGKGGDGGRVREMRERERREGKGGKRGGGRVYIGKRRGYGGEAVRRGGGKEGRQ